MFEMLTNSNKKWIATTNENSTNISLSSICMKRNKNETRREDWTKPITPTRLIRRAKMKQIKLKI